MNEGNFYSFEGQNECDIDTDLQPHISAHPHGAKDNWSRSSSIPWAPTALWSLLKKVSHSSTLAASEMSCAASTRLSRLELAAPHNILRLFITMVSWRSCLNHLQPVQKFLLQVNRVSWKTLQDSTTESLVSLKKKGLLIFYLRWASKRIY